MRSSFLISHLHLLDRITLSSTVNNPAPRASRAGPTSSNRITYLCVSPIAFYSLFSLFDRIRHQYCHVLYGSFQMPPYNSTSTADIAQYSSTSISGNCRNLPLHQLRQLRLHKHRESLQPLLRPQPLHIRPAPMLHGKHTN
jgi:hypothetical protein